MSSSRRQAISGLATSATSPFILAKLRRDSRRTRASPTRIASAIISWSPTKAAAQTAAALDRERLRTQAAQAEALAEGNRMRTALLAAVSHDLRTPLASVKASVSSLRQTDVEWSEADEADLLATGYRFEMSAIVSIQEEPDKYKPVSGPVATGAGESDEQGRAVLGKGDNVFRAKTDVSGVARFVSTVETVMEMLTEGVPENTIAVIDDSGGTLTAPILGDFTGVLCMGGTIRSHLGILTREYGVPCLMAVELDGLADGEEIVVEYSKPAADAYADAGTAAAQRARIIKNA